MRAKKATTPPRSIRYLLSADRKLQKISLRKIRERLKKAKQRPRSIRPKHGADRTPSVRLPWAMGWRAVVVGAMCVVGAAALITAGQPADRDSGGSVQEPRAATAPVMAPLEPTKPVVSKAAATRSVPRPAENPRAIEPVKAAKPRAIEPVKAPEPVQAAPAAAPVALASRAVAPADPAPTAAAPESAAKASAPAVAPVTITGCLEHNGDTFALKDTSGADAPKSRSWKTGFLKKRSSRIELVDAGNTLRLPAYVGQRVAATGILTNREMQARSVRRVAASCN